VVPPAFPGMRVGLFGGSFNPPHLGHLHVVLESFKRLRLDQLWILVVPCNPLKDADVLLSLQERIDAVRDLVEGYQNVVVSGLEAQLGSSYTVDTVRKLVNRYSATKFALIMGGDNLKNFHLWRSWWTISQMVPLAIVDRIETKLSGVSGPAATKLSKYRLPEHSADRLLDCIPPAWVLLHAPYKALASVDLRNHR